MSASVDFLNGVIERIEDEDDRITLRQLWEEHNTHVGSHYRSDVVFRRYQIGAYFWDDETLGDLRNTIRELRDYIEVV